MRAEFTPSLARGSVAAPPSKSMAHRLLLCAGLSGEKCRVGGISESQDMLATLDCLAAMGVQYEREGDTVSFFGGALNFAPEGTVSCRESGSTLRFFVPLFLLGEKEVTLTGHGRVMERPMTLYAELCAQRGLFFEQNGALLRLRGPLRSGTFRLRGDVSSQFVTGLLYALPLLSGESRIELIPPVESRPYIEMTRRAQSVFGVESRWEDENTLVIAGNQRYCASDCAVEGDWSNGAFFLAAKALGSNIEILGLQAESAQGDRAAAGIIETLSKGASTVCVPAQK
jgi:3-phosphoshikimate 1-carboxyvinyltransferase